MSAAFLDTQDELNVMNGVVLMLVGLGAHAGCAQFTEKSGIARIAVSPEPAQRAMEFLSGDTPTPMAGRNLLPLPMLQQVVTDFVERARQSQKVAWELV